MSVIRYFVIGGAIWTLCKIFLKLQGQEIQRQQRPAGVIRAKKYSKEIQFGKIVLDSKSHVSKILNEYVSIQEEPQKKKSGKEIRLLLPILQGLLISHTHAKTYFLFSNLTVIFQSGNVIPFVPHLAVICTHCLTVTKSPYIHISLIIMRCQMLFSVGLTLFLMKYLTTVCNVSAILTEFAY